MLSGRVARVLMTRQNASTSTTTTMMMMVGRRSLVQSADEVSARVARVLHDYRKHGHAYANVNPIEAAATPFRTQLYGLLESDVIANRTLTTANVNTVGELVAHLNRVYCNTLALEVLLLCYSHIYILNIHIYVIRRIIWMMKKLLGGQPSSKQRQVSSPTTNSLVMANCCCCRKHLMNMFTRNYVLSNGEKCDYMI
jgi:hypothetical protein